MLFSSLSPSAEDRHAPCVGGEKHGRLPRRVTLAPLSELQAVRRSSASQRATPSEMTFAASRSTRRSTSAASQLRSEVIVRRAEGRHRRRGASDESQRLSASPTGSRGSRRRACGPAGARDLQALPPTCPMRSRDNSRFERTCRLGRQAPPARPRSCFRPSDAPYTAAAKPAGPAPTITVSYSAATSSVPRSSSSATLRWCGRITVLSSIDPDRLQVHRRPVGPAPPVCRIRHVGRDPLKRDFVAVKEAPQLGAECIPAMPDNDRARRRRLRRDALKAPRSAHPMGRQPAYFLCDVRHQSRNGVVVASLDAHDARSLSPPESRPGRPSRARCTSPNTSPG